MAAPAHRVSPRLLVLALFALTVLVYLPVLRCGFIWDDDAYVTENPTLRDAHGLLRMWIVPRSIPQYYPLVHSLFWLEFHLWQIHPLGYHVVNVLLHASGAVLLWRALMRLQVPGAWLAAALFAVHPVMVESVAWITERKNVLSLVCYLAAALAWFRFAPPEDSSAPRRWQWYAAAFACFIGALLSKTVTCTLPAALLLVAWWKSGRLTWKTIVPLLPFFAAGIGLGLHTAWLEKHHVNAMGPDWQFSWADHCLIAGRVIWFYAGKMLWPAPLIFMYRRWEIDPAAVWQWLFPAAAVAALVGLWVTRRRIGRGPLTAALFFVGSLFPALGFFNVFPMRYSFVADHFQYLASLGVIVPAAALLVRWPRPVAAALVIVLGALTWRQLPIYHDVETLWRDTLAKNPECWMAQNNLGWALCERGRVREGIGHFEQALQMRPNNLETVNNMSSALSLEGRFDEAIDYSRRALAIDPDSGLAQITWGVALADQGKFAEALPHYQEGLRLEPNYSGTYMNLAEACAALGQTDNAIRYLREYVRIHPYSAEAINTLGSLLATKGDFAAATALFNAALKLKPDFVVARKNLANALFRSGEFAAATNEYAAVLRVSPDAPVRPRLAAAQAAVGDAPGAAQTLREAVRMTPADPALHLALGRVLVQLSRPAEARDEFQTVLKLKPGDTEAAGELQALPPGNPSEFNRR
jgi:tetratricopeptide (TPR) repeat protein